MQIVCISYTLWDRSVRFRMLTQTIPNAEILFFEPAQPLLSKYRRPREGAKTAPNVTAFTLPASVPSGEEGAARIAQRSRKNAAYIRRCMLEHAFDEPVLWLTCPDQAGLIYELSEARGLVYDCDRDWQGFPYDWEAALAEEADVVAAAAPSIQNRLRQFSGNVVMLPNGVDYPLFSQAAGTFPSLPTDLQRVFSPIFGYLGEVDDFTQLSPVYRAASQHPEWNFVFVGPCSRRNPGFSQLNRLTNVFFLGEKSLSTQPRYLSGFDVCFSLVSEQMEDPAVAPEQLYQYLASGKPIVMMTGGKLDDFYREVVSAAHFDAEFVVSCEALLEEEHAQGHAALRIHYAEGADWQQRSRQLYQILDANGLS